ncbi:Isoquinoline 1-oxidoreductase subunit [Pendulispora brunnea]|uniref:Isoquinoline 1-oxidoreductase subunit n=1 Tax=Pendulispora brunnea TaxID=2905690 RepID=A0ABZ2KLW9_9BACT
MIPTVRGACCTLGLLLFACGGTPAPEPSTTRGGAPPLPPVAANDLRAPEAFAGISDTTERSRALFTEASRVMLHPRCVNCHPAGDSPHQRDDMALHDPPVVRGPEDKGVVGMQCTSCHQERNPVLARVPGAPQWHLAPKTMAWEGRSAAAICAQVKDPARNGGKSLQQIVEHSGHDPLVGWGWSPGADRAPAPGSQAKFGALVAAWVATGAACPSDKSEKEAKR